MIVIPQNISINLNIVEYKDFSHFRIVWSWFRINLNIVEYKDRKY